MLTIPQLLNFKENEMSLVTDKPAELAIQSGQTWKYIGTTPKNGKTGENYVITGKPLMKTGDGADSKWVSGVLYVRLDNEGHVAEDEEPAVFCRDEENFRKKFEFVPA
jgi:hypothetical protein